MPNLRLAATQALDVLEQLQGGCTDSDDGTVEVITVWCPEVVDALRAALAQQDAQAVERVGDPVTITRLAALVDEETQRILADSLSLIEQIKYMVGIAERGTGKKCPDDERPEAFLLAYVKSLEAALAQQAAHAVPHGYKLVPVEPTPEMCNPSGDVGIVAEMAARYRREIWEIMLNAAPTPPVIPGWCPGCSPENCQGCGPAAPTPPAPKPLGWLDRKAVECLQSTEMNWMPTWNRPTSSDPVPIFLSPPAQRVTLTDEEIVQLCLECPAETNDWVSHMEYARAVIEAYERKNGISQPGYTAPDMASQGASQFRAGHDAAQSEIAELEQENRLLRARNDRLQKEIEQKGER